MTIGQRIKSVYDVFGAFCQGRSVFIMFAFNGELCKISIMRYAHTMHVKHDL